MAMKKLELQALVLVKHSFWQWCNRKFDENNYKP
jgi:hypothetical protein